MENKTDVIHQLDKSIKSCKKCRLFRDTKNAVPGEGDINSEIVFVGEAPGKVEDETGRPFVGRAGMLLEKMLKRIEKSRKQVWIGNIIKHRPPDNRDPLPDEINACQPYLTMQLKIINPVLVVTLGRFAMNYFYKEGKISRDRGKLIRTKNHVIYPVYHPAAALRNGSMMEVFIEDFLKIPEVVEKVKSGEAPEFDDSAGTGDPKDGQLGLIFK